MKKVVTIGGGTGTYVVLSALKNNLDISLTAIVSSADDGGSNKKFRDEFGLLPPSDFAQCLVALADEDKSDHLLRRLFSYRFSKGNGMEGQRLSNILIAALTDIEGSQLKAMEKIGDVFHIKGDILPITTKDIRLMAEYENGDIAFSEHLIDEPDDDHDSKQRIKRLFLNKSAPIYQKAKESIIDADLIVMGPGDLYTSTIANLVVDDVKDTLTKTNAKILYIMNLMTKYGQTYGFTAMDHLNELRSYAGRFPDYVLINNKELPQSSLEKYRKQFDEPVIDDIANSYPGDVIRTDLVNVEEVKVNSSDKLKRSLIRHSSEKIAIQILSLLK